MVVPSLSQLSTSTATEIGEYQVPNLSALLSIDDWAISSSGVYFNTEKFVYENFHFIIQYKNHVLFESKEKARGKTQLELIVYPTKLAEWQLLYQLRIRVGHENPKETEVVDRLIAEFHSGSKPINITVSDERIRFVKLELRTINKVFWPHPLFRDGDVDILFEDGSKLRTWKAVLAQASPYMAKFLLNPDCNGLNVGDFPKDAMVELLLHLYLIRRPIYNFEMLAKAATGYKVDSLIYKLSKHILELGFRQMSMKAKWKLAMKTELVGALQELVYYAIEIGYWDHRLCDGWQPIEFFGGTYKELVEPVIAAARGHPSTWTHLVDPWEQPDYFRPGPFKIPLYFRGTKFYVNYGVLQLQGVENFKREDNGLLMAHFTKEMEFICGKTNIVPGKALIALLNSLHPGGPPIEPKYLRATIVFCYDHKWLLAKEELEQRLQLEPPQSAQHFMEQIVFAERFQLLNMLRACLFRAENSCFELAKELAKEGFPGASPEIKNSLVDRLCTGWSLHPKVFNTLSVRRGTEEVDREVATGIGGPAEAGNDQPTMAEVASEYIFEMGDFIKEEVSDLETNLQEA